VAFIHPQTSPIPQIKKKNLWIMFFYIENYCRAGRSQKNLQRRIRFEMWHQAKARFDRFFNPQNKGFENWE
jgi:hypothetical protein